MKKVIVRVLITGIVIILCTALVVAQKEQNLKFEINRSQVIQKQVSGKTVNYIDQKILKNGLNFLKLDTGNILSTNVINSKISSFKLTNSKGVQLGFLEIPKGGITHFICDAGSCACWGDRDCNNMFSSSVCGEVVYSIGSLYICLK